MSRARMRPLFKLELPIKVARLQAEIRERLGAPNARYVGKVLRRHVELTVAPGERHFWSPHLSLDLFEEGDSTRLRGRYAPHPSIWTCIMAIYGLLAIVAIAGTVWGASQWNLGWTPWGLWALPVSALLVAVTWGVSAIGQRLAQAQMEEMHAFIEGCLERASLAPGPLPHGEQDEPGINEVRPLLVTP